MKWVKPPLLINELDSCMCIKYKLSFGIEVTYFFIRSTPKGLEDVSRYPQLLATLLEDPAWTEEDIKKLAGLNLLRVFGKVEQVNISPRDFYLNVYQPNRMTLIAFFCNLGERRVAESRGTAGREDQSAWELGLCLRLDVIIWTVNSGSFAWCMSHASRNTPDMLGFGFLHKQDIDKQGAENHVVARNSSSIDCLWW